MEWLSTPEAWIALGTLTALEIVLGIDNIVFISILAGKLPESQRRKARQEQRAEAGVSSRARARQQAVRPSAQPQKTQTGGRRVRGGGFRRFVGECWGELKKVEWPNQSQVMQGTIVVIIACVIVGAYLYAADQLFKPLVRDLLLR